MNDKKIHLKLSEIKINNDNLDYIKMTGEICGKLRDDLVQMFSSDALSPLTAWEKGDKYQIDLINELINMIENPEDSNKEWKHTIIDVAREKGYGGEIVEDDIEYCQCPPRYPYVITDTRCKSCGKINR